MRRPDKLMAARALAASLVISLATAGIVAGSQAGPGYLAVSDWTASEQGTNGVRLTATTNGSIPKQPDEFIDSNAIVGIAWVDADTWTALVATIHPVIGRDSNQRPDSWHIHTVTLDPSGAIAPDDVCLVSVDSTPTAGINVQGSLFSVNLDRSSLPAGVDAGDFDLAVGFTVHADGGCGSGLGVRIRT